MTRFDLPNYVEPAGPIIHQAAAGLPGIEVQHPSGECAWCDAERWREVWDQATKDGHRAYIDTVILY